MTEFQHPGKMVLWYLTSFSTFHMEWVYCISEFIDERWVCPADLSAFLAIKLVNFGRSKKHEVYCHRAVFAGL